VPEKRGGNSADEYKKDASFGSPALGRSTLGKKEDNKKAFHWWQKVGSHCQFLASSQEGGGNPRIGNKAYAMARKNRRNKGSKIVVSHVVDGGPRRGGRINQDGTTIGKEGTRGKKKKERSNLFSKRFRRFDWKGPGRGPGR